MIDETLYQLATDELNSDQRKPDIWARACALASNDHDEARYLYTNLRVEQMIKEHEQKAKAQVSSGGIPDIDIAKPKDPQGNHPKISLDPAILLEQGASLNEMKELDPALKTNSDTLESTRPGQTSEANLKAEGLELEGDISDISSVSSNEGNSLELSLDDFDLDPADVVQMNDSEPGNRSSIHGQITTADDNSKLEDANTISMEDDPLAYWAQQHQAQLRDSKENYNEPVTDKDTPLGKELERQADELPGQTSDIVSVETVDASTSAKPDYSAPSLGDEPSIADLNATSDAASLTDSPVHYDYADDDNNIANDIINTPTPRPGSGKRYYVYSREGRSKAVKDGVSWPAMFVTLPWLLTKGMLGTSIVYAVLWIILLAGLLTSGFAWMDAGAASSTAAKVWTGLFALLAIVALVYLPFRHGNEWVQNKLINRGYELDALVHAKNPKDAINASLDSASI